MRYLLDANAVIALLNDTTSPIARRVRRHVPRDIGVSAVVIHELSYGASKSPRVENKRGPRTSHPRGHPLVPMMCSSPGRPRHAN